MRDLGRVLGHWASLHVLRQRARDAEQPTTVWHDRPVPSPMRKAGVISRKQKHDSEMADRQEELSKAKEPVTMNVVPGSDAPGNLERESRTLKHHNAAVVRIMRAWERRLRNVGFWKGGERIW